MAADDIKEAIADIDGEVTRLNRLVNEVLDFARPIRFDLAVTDVNRVCEQSAAAANADGVGATVHLQIAASLPRVVSDGDRLRSALVNILVNARHAVAARASATEAQAAGAAAAAPAGTGTPDVVLVTSAGGNGRVRIAVRDRGVGIAPDDLPRVFEPYFTTKRTGTGLGLAIARNIIEGLGGTIAVASEPATGTEIRIELPADPPVASHENPDLLTS
jgi:signal transduction histidine kinase